MSNHFNFSQDSNFYDVFGDYPNAYSEEERVQRWEAFKATLSISMQRFYEDCTACSGCVHLDQDRRWCKHVGFPCNVNPTFGFKVLQMACGGIAYETQELMLNLFDQD